MLIRVTEAYRFVLHTTKLLQNSYRAQRWVSSLDQFPVIRVPVALSEKLKREKIKVKRKERELIVDKSRRGDQSTPIISCKRKEYNHYLGQTYDKFAVVPLASKGWGHRKSSGDYFTINTSNGNPAFQELEDSHEDFVSLGLDKEMQSQLNKLGFEKPTNIQSLAIPHLLEGKNALIAAETGNGKTLAFITPMLQQIRQRMKIFGTNLPMNSPLGLVIVPGRELAEQIHSVASSLGENFGINVGIVLGGRTKQKMLHPRMSQHHLLIATIGALSKLTTVGVYDTSLVRHVTLDEADTLLDDSFNDQVSRYISKFPVQGSRYEEKQQQPLVMSGIQLTLVSATLPLSLHTILDPIVDLESITNITTPYLNHLMPHVSQRFFRVNHLTKAEKLLELVKKDAKKGTPVVIFSNYSKTCDWLSLFLNENGVPCIRFHGNMQAESRKGLFETFQSGKVLALSCTDLASRGLDTVTAGHVINFEFPKFIADYIHRCGRTGRVGSKMTGLVTNLVHRPQEIELVQKIEYAARKLEAFSNVNANIKRIIVGKALTEHDKLSKMSL